MKAGWQVKKLKEICTFENGDRGTNYPSRSARTNEGIPFINAGHLTDDGIDIHGMDYISRERFDLLGSGKIRKGDILFCLRGSLGKFASAGDLSLGAIASSLVIIRPSEFVLDQYILAYLGSRLCSEQINFYKNGAAQPNLSAGSLGEFLIPIPPLSEQQRIVSIFEEAFWGIAIAKANAEKNLQNTRELFESYLQSVFTQNNNNWIEKKLGDKCILDIIDGDRGVHYPKATDFFDHEYCLFLNTKNVRPAGFEFESTMFISQQKDKELRKGKLQRNDVVMTTRGTIGNIGLYTASIEYENIRINSGMLIFRANPQVLLPEYLFEVLRSGIVKRQIARHVSGAAQPQLPIKTIVNFSIPIPKNIQEQQAIVGKLNTLYDKTKRLESIYQQKLTALDELKKSLLQKAFNGEL